MLKHIHPTNLPWTHPNQHSQQILCTKVISLSFTSGRVSLVVRKCFVEFLRREYEKSSQI